MSRLANGPLSTERHTTITWEEYLRLQRDRDILDWVATDFDRHVKPGSPGLRDIVGGLLDAGDGLQQTIAEAARDFIQRRGGRRAE
jgi:hypothetical protein